MKIKRILALLLVGIMVFSFAACKENKPQPSKPGTLYAGLIYEIMWTDTPDVTCIDEAVELSKEYSDEKVCKMINGVLDKVYHSKDKND